MTEPRKVHGLTNDWVEPDWPFLTLPEVDTLLRRFPGARGAEAILTISPRPFSAAGKVKTPAGMVFVKRHHASVRDRDALLEEHRFLKYLLSQGAPVPCVLADDHGETAIPSGEWTYEVHSVAEGGDLYEQNLSWTPFHNCEHAFGAGRALARLHVAASGYEAPGRTAKMLVSSFSICGAPNVCAAFAGFVADRAALADYLRSHNGQERFAEVIAPFHDELRPWLRHLGSQWTHNDFHASNLFWRDNPVGVASIIDFGLSDRTNIVYDLAIAIERNGVRWLDLEGNFDEVVHWQQIRSLLDGYTSVFALTPAQARALVAMLPLAHVEFALSEADYFLQVLHSEEKADLAWHGYCLGHARWFRGKAGRELLGRLSDWALEFARNTEQAKDVTS